jgi:hypothetical protein
MGNITYNAYKQSIELYKDILYRKVIIIDYNNPDETLTTELINEICVKKLERNYGLYINLYLETIETEFYTNNYIVTVTDNKKIMYEYKYFYDKLQKKFPEYILIPSGSNGSYITFITRA